MSLRQGMPVGAGCVFREDFLNSMAVQDQEGVITGTPIVDRRLEASAPNTDMVQYGGNARGLLSGAEYATWALRFKTGPSIAADNLLLSRYVNAANGMFWFEIVTNRIDIHIANVGLGADRLERIGGVAANTEYAFTLVYNKTNALAGYLDGLPVVVTPIAGTMPARLSLACIEPLEVFSLNGTKYAQVGMIMRSIKVFDFLMSAEEVKDLYEQDTCTEIVP